MSYIIKQRILNLPSVTLTNGLVVANWTSPHPFLFEDGSKLDACTKERAILTMLKSEEQVRCKHDKYVSIKIEWGLTWFLEEEIKKILNLWDNDRLPWNIMITPRPLLQAMTVNNTILYGRLNNCDHPFRVVRLVDRTEPKVTSINKFCVI